VKSGNTRFEVRLDPADLGRIDVRIDVDRSGQVTLAFDGREAGDPVDVAAGRTSTANKR